MSEQEPKSNQESLEIIGDMISKAKRNIAKGGSFYFLLWGFVVSIANLSFYYLEAVVKYDKPYVVWIITFPASIITIVYSIRQGKRARAVSHFDRIYGHVWSAIFIGIMILLVFMKEINMNQNAVILLFSGMGTYASGQMLRFKPLIFGGISLFIASIIAFKVSPIDQNLVAGLGIIVGYIIPGFMLKRKEGE